MFPRMLLKKCCLFSGLVFILLVGSFYFFRDDDSPTNFEAHEPGDRFLTNDLDSSDDPATTPDKFQLPYTMPSELDYENMNEILPHFWKTAMDTPMPSSCQLITFDYNPDMDMGESMFLYAAFYGIARRTKRIPFISTSTGFPLYQIFTLRWMPTSGTSADDSFVTYRESSGCCRYDKKFMNVSCDSKLLISGSYQNYQYFKPYQSELLKTEFVFQQDVRQECSKDFSELLSENGVPKKCRLIGVHVRHPDEINSRQKEKGHVGADATYLEKAFDYYKRKFSKSCVVFLVAGREGTRNKELLPKKGSQILILGSSNEAIQFCALSMCHHTVITTGSFGWWVAFMTQQRNGGTVLYQRDYARPNSDLVNELDPRTYFPGSWIGV